MTRLGPKQLDLLRRIGTTSALVVPTAMSRRLVDLGMMQAEDDGSLARITPKGLRALADAVDAGRVILFDPVAVLERMRDRAAKVGGMG